MPDFTPRSVRSGREPSVTKTSRRTFLQAGRAALAWLLRPGSFIAAAGGTAAPAVAAGAASAAALAGAFDATTAPDALRLLYGGAHIEPSPAVALTAPQRADNGADVPIAVAATLEGVRAIAIVIEKNPRPLAAVFETPNGTKPEITCRIKIAESCTVLAVVETAGGLFSAAAEVTVTQGGCA
jgi:sulfur-oxidizing protein SoxY